MHYRSLGVPVSVGIGGTIDFLAGKLDRAPVWMQRGGVEWIYRLAQEPKRLGGRYARDMVHFGGGMAAQFWRMRSRRKKPRPQNSGEPRAKVRVDLPFTVAKLPARLDCEEAHECKERMDAFASLAQPLVLDASAVEFIDSTGVGLLIRLHKRTRLNGQSMLLASSSPQIERALRWMRLEHFFETAPDLEQAKARLEARAGAGSAHVQLRSVSEGHGAEMVWRGELTAANAEEVWVATMDHLAARSMVQRTLVINLAELQFIDSTGLGVMIRAKKFGARQQVDIRFANASENVRNVIRISRLEDFLLKP
jgi:N-acetylglucosaminyldiphosphoundecaprenol N-acetyl-beta-D-mannosaminyltransferase